MAYNMKGFSGFGNSPLRQGKIERIGKIAGTAAKEAAKKIKTKPIRLLPSQADYDFAKENKIPMVLYPEKYDYKTKEEMGILEFGDPNALKIDKTAPPQPSLSEYLKVGRD